MLILKRRSDFNFLENQCRRWIVSLFMASELVSNIRLKTSGFGFEFDHLSVCSIKNA